MFNFSKRSITNFTKVHPLLIAVMVRALSLSKVDFIVTEGLRTLSRQKELVAQGASQTMNSLHLPQHDGNSHAVDVAAYVNKTVSWDMKHYKDISTAVKQAASELNIDVEWGGDWKTFKDGPHFQLGKRHRS